MKIAFLIDGSKISKKITSTMKTLSNEVFYYNVLWVIILAIALLITLGVIRVKRLAKKMTAQIIHLYETLY